jgi:XTP/dITP diphosphohydrolase/tetrapyrrole methylase family protein/MazG family protein/ATP diphosphatase
VFGDREVADAGEVLRNWDEIKKTEEGRMPGIFGDVPENLPGPLYARKLLRRASSAGRGFAPAEDLPPRLRGAAERAAGLAEDAATGGPDHQLTGGAPAPERDERFAAVGELMFTAVALARELRVDPELALRAAADDFRRATQEADPPSE